MLNISVIEGILTDEVKLCFDEAKKVSKAGFHIDNLQKKGKKHHANKFYVVTYGKEAEECARFLKEGMCVRALGSIITWAQVDEHGNKTTGATINATKVYWS